MIRLFRLIVPAGVPPLLLSELLLVAASYFAAAWLAAGMDPSIYFLYDDGIRRLIVVIASFLLAMYLHNLYSRVQVKSRFYLFQQLLQVAGLTLIAQAMVSYAGENWTLPLRIMLTGCFLSVVTIFCWRVVYGTYLLKVLGAQKILLVGSSPILQGIARGIAEDPDRGYAITGYLADGADAGLPGVPLLGNLASLKEVAAARRPQRVVVGFAEPRQQMPVADLVDLRTTGIAVDEAGAAYEQILRRVCAADLRPAPLIFERALNPAADRMWIQDICNRALAAASGLLLLPVIAMVAAALKVTGGGPVLVRRESVGKGGGVYGQLRFRLGGKGRLGFYKTICSVCRRFHLDGLPELWNVLRGEMSLVGPEPDRPEFASALAERIPFYDYRHNVRPGMTGWARINVPKESSQDAMLRLEYDLYYIKHMSLSLNTYILMHSLKRKLAGVM